MAQAISTERTSSGGTTTRPEHSVAEWVADLRQRAQADPVGVREETWSWIQALGERARENRREAHEQLHQLFRCGEPADDLSGQTEGILVASTVHPLADRVIAAITDAWLPWLGKSFAPEHRRGANTLTRGARLPSKLLWPRYSMTESPLGHSAFEFTTRVEPGRLDPEVDVLVIDYASVRENPALTIRRVRDELVRIVPGANLGKMLVDVPGRRKPFPALYFALKSDV